jgi:sugar porter (SP) family MFS transporter
MSSARVRGQGSGRSRLGLVATVAALGGFLFGYDTGVISDALLYIGPAFGLGNTGKQVVVAALLLGALVGALLGGRLADGLGRKRTLVGAAVVFAGAAVLAGLSPNVAVLVAARVLLGLAIGASSSCVPLYLAEIAPPESRGRLVSLNQFLITVGILVSYGVGAALAPAEAWRWMLALAAVPSLVMLAGLVLLPESPRWLLLRGRRQDAGEVLAAVQGRASDDRAVSDQIRELAELQAQEEGASYRDLFTPRLRPALRIGIAVPAINQLVGVNAIIYYAPTLLKNVGFSDTGATVATVVIGAINTIVTLIALLVIDRVGRRPLIIGGVLVVDLALIFLGVLYLLPSQTGVVTILLIVGLCVYIAAFAASLGIGIWLINSEVYPTAVRGKGSSLGVFTHWGLDFVISLTVLTLVDAITPTGLFWLYGALGVAGLLFLLRFLPETKGRTLEEINADLRGLPLASPSSVGGTSG